MKKYLSATIIIVLLIIVVLTSNAKAKCYDKNLYEQGIQCYNNGNYNYDVIFEKEKMKREAKVIQRLKDIREVQTLFKEHHNRYTASFDTLIEFINVGMIPVIDIIPDPNDTTFTKVINDTIGYVKVLDSVFAKRPNFNPESLRYIPYSKPQQEFELKAGFIMCRGNKVPVFEVKAHYNTYLEGLDKLKIKKIVNQSVSLGKYPGLKIGSMNKESVGGNWEFI